MSDHKLNSIELKLEAIIEKLHDMNVTLAENTQSLIIHEKRTDLAERKIEVLNSRIDELKDRENEQFKELTAEVKSTFKSLEEQILPVKIHVETMEKILNIVFKYIVPGLAGLATLLYSLGILKFGGK